MFLSEKGYWMINPKFPLHLKVYREHYGTKEPGWHIHHINGVKTDNRPHNLIALPKRLHFTLHLLNPLPDRKTIELWLREYPRKRLDRKAVKRQRSKIRGRKWKAQAGHLKREKKIVSRRCDVG